MAYLLVVLMFATAVGIAHLLAEISDKLIRAHIFKLVDEEELRGSWLRYIRLAVYVVGITGGIEVYRLERALSAYEFSVGSLVSELYRVASGAAVSVIWLLLPVFIGSLVIVEVRKTFGRRGEKDGEAAE